MLHWPDSMAVYLTGDNILFSNDAFGQHYASNTMFNDAADQCELFEEALKYYANILTPFSAILKRKLEEVLALNLTFDIIAPSHGVIWRDNPLQIVEKYAAWCEITKRTNYIALTLCGWDAYPRRRLRRYHEADPDVALRFSISKTDKNDIMVVFKSKWWCWLPTVGGHISSVDLSLYERCSR